MKNIISALAGSAVLGMLAWITNSPDVRSATGAGLLCIGLACLGYVWREDIRRAFRVHSPGATMSPGTSVLATIAISLVLTLLATMLWGRPAETKANIPIIIGALLLCSLLFAVYRLRKRGRIHLTGRSSISDRRDPVPPIRPEPPLPPRDRTDDLTRTRPMPVDRR